MKLFGRKASEGEILTGGENAIANKEVEGLSQGQIVRRRFFRHRAAVVALITLASIILFVMTALETKIGPLRIPGWWKYSPSDVDLPDLRVGCPGDVTGCPTLSLKPGPNFGLGDHPFGQDDIGRDYFSLVMRGAEQSIMVMLIIGFLGGLIGTVVGAVAGYFRGRIDGFLMRVVDLFTTIPVILIGAVIGFKVGNLGVVVLAIFLGLFGWIGLARLVRGEFLSLREREFVDAARVAGASHRRIIFKHILPNAVGIIIVAVTLSMSGAILLETGLSYLGFGVVSPDVSLGSLISQYQDSFATRPWLFWWPGLFIIAIALCINFIGDGLRDAFDPRQRRRISKKDRAQAKLAAKVSA